MSGERQTLIDVLQLKISVLSYFLPQEKKQCCTSPTEEMVVDTKSVSSDKGLIRIRGSFSGLLRQTGATKRGLYM